MPLGDFTTIDAVWVALSFFLVLVALGLAFVLFRLAGTIGRLTTLVEGLEREALPVIHESGGTIERVNLQLDKMDRVTDSAVDAADRADTAVRAVSMAVTRPVQKVSGLMEGVAHGAASLRAHRSVRVALQEGRSAARRREEEIAEELKRPDTGEH
jgi:uncharacterized protein YoxC